MPRFRVVLGVLAICIKPGATAGLDDREPGRHPGIRTWVAWRCRWWGAAMPLRSGLPPQRGDEGLRRQPETLSGFDRHSSART